jgi:hypothetical protein
MNLDGTGGKTPQNLAAEQRMGADPPSQKSWQISPISDHLRSSAAKLFFLGFRSRYTAR